MRALDSRDDLSWPASPDIEAPRAKAHIKKLPGIRAVTWSVYGTLMAIVGGDLLFEVPQRLIMDLAMDKAIREFKMWGAMSRKPGQPSEYMVPTYLELLARQRMLGGGHVRHPEIAIERVWENLIKRLLKKDYVFDAAYYGALNEFSQKVAYFFQASLQGSGCYAGAANTLSKLARRGITQALLSDGQCFTSAHLAHLLNRQVAGIDAGGVLDRDVSTLSHQFGARKPSDHLFRRTLTKLAEKNIKADQVLHVGSRVVQDIAPARRLGMRTALFAGDRASLHATPKQMEQSANRPDVLLTDLPQITDVVC
jgi:FMN phosphatase YigB (HAD superfamily)